MGASLFLTGCGKSDGGVVERTKAEVPSAQVIAYARTDTSTNTNIFLTVTEIWKGSGVASGFGITNGVQFSQKWSRWNGSLPEGAIFLLSVDTNDQSSTEETIWVRSGHVENMTVQEFKAKIGL